MTDYKYEVYMAAGMKGLAEREKMKTGDNAAITEMEVFINGFLFMRISNSIRVLSIFDEKMTFVIFFCINWLSERIKIIKCMYV